MLIALLAILTVAVAAAVPLARIVFAARPRVSGR